MAARLPLFTREFLLLLLGHFLQAVGFASMLLLPLYLEHLGASRTEIGVLMALGSLGGLSSRPLVGWSLDTWGRKPTLLAGTGVLVVAMLLLYFVRSLGPLIYLDRLIFGVGAGTLFAGYFTWAADVIPADRRTEGIALFGITGLLPIGLNAFSDKAGLAAPDLRLLYPGLAVVIALSVLTLLPLAESTKKSEREQFKLREVVRALTGRTLWAPWLATAVFGTLVGVFMSFATVSAAGMGVAEPAGLWLPYSLGAVGVRLFGAKLPDRVGPANLVAPAVALYLAGLLLTTSADSGWDFGVAALLSGLGHGYCFPVLLGQVVTRCSQRYRGSAVAMFTAMFSVCELATPPLFGAIADRHSDQVMYWVALLGCLVGLTLWCGLEHFLQPQPPERPNSAS